MLGFNARIIGFIVTLLVVGPFTAAAQFVTPLPPPLPDSLVVAEYYQYQFLATVSPADTGVLVRDRARLAGAVTAFCERQEEPRRQACANALNVDSIVDRQTILKPRERPTSLRFSVPFLHRERRRRAELIAYLERARGTAGIAVFNQFTANVSGRTAYVTTDIISGLTGGTVLGIQYAAVVVKDTAQALAARRSIEDNTATALRMVNNGGTVTARLQYPLYAGGGTTFQTATSIYGTVGVIGPVGNPDSLHLSLSAVGELMTGIAIRDADARGGVLGELVLGVRGGTGWSESELIPGSGRKWLPFSQAAVGVRQNGKLGLSLLYTWVGNKETFRSVVPKFIVNFSALR